MLINELVQWIVLIFVGVFLLGLTRQLGFFLMPRRQQLATHGPSLGRVLPEALLSTADRRELRQLIAERNSLLAAYVVIYDKCDSCQELLQDLRESAGESRLPVAALAVGSDARFQQAAAEACDMVIFDPRGEIREQTDIIATPFVMLLDSQLRVVAKEVTSDLAEAVARQVGAQEVLLEPAISKS